MAAPEVAAPPRRKPTPNYWNMWPIALAPVIPLLGIAFKRQPRVRNALIAATGGAVLLYAHGSAIGGSSSIS